jgi:hypothetical protein
MKLNFTYLVCGSAAIFYNLLVSLPAHALDTYVTWYLNDVSFSDGSTATGDFIYDATTDVLSGGSITLNQGSSSVVFTSGDFGSTFASYNSKYNTLEICTNPTSLTTCAGTELVLDTTNDFTSTTSGSEDINLNTYINPLRRSSYSTFGSSPIYAISGTVYRIPFNVPGGEGSVLLGGVLAMGAVRRLKNYSSSAKIANSTSGKVVD